MRKLSLRIILSVALFCVCIGAAALLAFSRAAAPNAAQESVPTGDVAADLAGRLLVDTSGNAQLIGYYSYISGIQGTFFSGPTSEATAFFTFRSTPFTIEIVPNGNLFQLFSTPAAGLTEYIDSVYLNERPAGNFQDPDSFSKGQLIAQFKNTHFTGTTTGVAGNEAGSLQLISSRDFVFQGQTYNLRKLTHELTISLTFGPPYSGALGSGSAVVPFGGYALAVANGQPSKNGDDTEDHER